jgi:gliding-associated putative ABC transporter substrate-binding component GldG
MFNDKTKQKTDFSIMVLIIIGILIMVNFFSYQIFYRWDLTQNKDYSISKTSKGAISKLDDIVNVKAYFSSNVPSQYINLKQEVGDILDEYRTYSGGKIKTEFIDPADDNTKQTLYTAGIPELQFNVMEKDKLQVVKGYLGMIIQYGDKKEVIPVIQDTSNLEYQITLAVKKLTAKNLPVLGLLTSNGAPSKDSELKTAYTALSKLYEIRDVDLKTNSDISTDITTLLIVGPTQKFSDQELKGIDKFLMAGKSVLVSVDGVTVGQGLSATSNNTDLEKLLTKYGVRLNHDLVLDVVSGTASFSQGFMSFTLNYPFWPKVVKGRFDSNYAAVAKLESAVFPWASSIDVLTDSIDKSDKISYLAKTTDKARLQESNYNLNPQLDFTAAQKEGTYDLAVAVSGKFKSAYGKEETSSGRLIAIGDSDFMRDNFLQNNPDNLLMFQNLVDSLSLDQDLINIRSKGVSERPIKDGLSDSTRAAIRYFNIFGLTILVIVYGIFRYFMRKRSSFADEL